jgi:hypothetical protein
MWAGLAKTLRKLLWTWPLKGPRFSAPTASPSSNRPCAASNVKTMERADWKAVDAAMIQVASIARDVTSCRHAKLSAVRLAREIKHGPADGASLDELFGEDQGRVKQVGRFPRPTLPRPPSSRAQLSPSRRSQEKSDTS